MASWRCLPRPAAAGAPAPGPAPLGEPLGPQGEEEENHGTGEAAASAVPASIPDSDDAYRDPQNGESASERVPAQAQGFRFP